MQLPKLNSHDQTKQGIEQTEGQEESLKSDMQPRITLLVNT